MTLNNSGVISILFILFSCSSQEKVTKKSSIEAWKINNYVDSVQILLTNKFQLNDSFGYGASSFLLQSKNDTLLCTAKHLIEEPMGFVPKIRTDSFNINFKYWKAYPRQNNLSNDTINCTRLINETITDVDIIIQDCIIGEKNDIQILKPRFTRAKPGESFEIIGCEYSDTDCYQHKFSAKFDAYEDGKIGVVSELNFSPGEFSGAPVIDSNGFVIGVVSTGGEIHGKLYLSIEPLSKIRHYLE